VRNAVSSRRLACIVATVGTVLLPLCAGARATATDPAPRPPEVWSGKALLVEGTAVILQGWVRPRGQLTTCYFEVGTTTSYGLFSDPNETEPSGYRNHEIHKSIPGLRPRTTYHFRLVAHSRGGTTYGKDKTFRTFKRLGPGAKR
jgi:hypothetical protein